MTEITQADRDAALSLAMRAGNGLHPKDVADVLSGRHDKNAIVEALARHRLAERERIRKILGTERQALVVELWEVGRDGVWKSGRNPTSSHPITIKAANQIEADGQRIAELEAALREVFEEWAGSEGFIPETAPEGYLLELVKKMALIASAALGEKAGD